jgi:hypothetical protein
MLSWRISKYNPKFRNKKSEYQKDEWTSCYDIGKLYNEKEFYVKYYMSVENAYINVLLSFLDITNTTVLIVKNLEKYNDNININESSLIYTEEMLKLFERIEENSVLEINDILNLCRLILREQLWGKLENESSLYVHFGYDYYMYFGCSKNCKGLDEIIVKNGLFIEKLKSPYYE